MTATWPVKKLRLLKTQEPNLPKAHKQQAPMHLDTGRLVLTNLTDLRPEEVCLKAVTDILNVPHHVYFIAVREVEEGGLTLQLAVCDPYDRLNDVRRLNEGTLMTVRLPGYEGDYVMVLFPFAD